MTRLTLEWHLRGIIEGTTDGACVRADIEYGPGDRYWATKRYYTDPSTNDFQEYDSQSKADSYTTGFRQDCGEFCDVIDVPARDALNSDDPVTFLDAVANDPARRAQERNDAAWLLSRHIWPDGELCHALRCDTCLEGECLCDPDVLRDYDRVVCMTCGTEQSRPAYP